MIILYLLYYWLEHFDPFYVYIYREPIYLYNFTFFLTASLSILVLGISVITMVLLKKEKRELKTYQYIILSFFVPGLGQAAQGYLPWGLLLIILNSLFWIINPLPWIHFEWVIFIFNLFDCYSKTRRSNMSLWVMFSLVILNMLFPGMGQVYSGATKMGFFLLFLSAIGSTLIFWVPISDGNVDNGFNLLWYLAALAIIGLLTYLPIILSQFTKRDH